MALFLSFQVLGILWVLVPRSDAPYRYVVTIIVLVVALTVAWSVRHQWRRLGWGVVGLLLGAGSAFWGVEGGINPIWKLPVERGTYQVTGLMSDMAVGEGRTQLWIEQAIITSQDGHSSEHHYEVPGVLLLKVYRQQVDVLPGDRIGGRFRLYRPHGSKVPGVFDYARYLRHQGITATGYLRGSMQRIESTDAWRVNRFRERFSRWIGRHLSAEIHGVTEALLLGKRGRIAPEQNEALRTSGLIHLVAISGLHLGLVAGWSFVLLRLLMALIPAFSIRWDVRRPAAFLALIPMLGYGALAGWSLPTQRAAIMAVSLLVAVGLGRSNQSWRALGMAAILLLLWRPHELLGAGFQLSFAAVALLLFVTSLEVGPKLRQWLRKREVMVADTHGAPSRPHLSWLQRLGVQGVLLALGSAAVGLGLAPLTAHHFHQISPYGLPANLLAIPLVGLVAVPLGLMTLLLYGLWEGAAVLFLEMAGGTLQGLLVWAEVVTDWPGSWVRLPGPHLAGVVLFLAGGVGVVVWRRWWWRLGAMSVGVVGLLWPYPEPPSGHFHLASLDVGQAQSLVLRAPDGAWSVLDAGGALTARFNVGESIISPYLWRHNVRHLKRVVLSHLDKDHMAGAARLLRNFTVGSLWIPLPNGDDQQRPLVKQLMKVAKEQEVPVREVGLGEVDHDGPLAIRVLHPALDDGLEAREALSPNNRSLVLELSWRGLRILIPGDIEQPAEQQLLASDLLMKVSIVVAPHHGSKSSSSPAFIKTLDADHVLFSLGRANRYGFPHPLIWRRWRDAGVTPWRTDHHGTLTISSDGQSYRVIPFVRPGG
ncbi:MAG: DNA internalization-related competence protein ComEC/Rec2 [Magnetococcales bacterium]|nr:DNA internalization-related competence protein ComEC/Rec2 [Magnetococcales bacterium]